MTFLIFIFRFLIFNLEESSKFLIAKGRDEEAIAVGYSLLSQFDRVLISLLRC